MSKNPYLAASRPTSSFTRSSRSSKRNEPSKGSLLSRSRSSATIGSGLSNQLGASRGYNPLGNYLSTPSSTWQRSSSSTRLNRLSTDPSPSTTSSYRANDYTPTNQRNAHNGRTSRSLEVSQPSMYKSTSTQDLISNVNDNSNDKPGSSSVLFVRL